MHYSLQDEELRWLRDTYNGMDFLSGHFTSDYHTVRPCPYLFNGRYVLLEIDVTPSLQKGRAKFEGPHGGSVRGPA